MSPVQRRPAPLGHVQGKVVHGFDLGVGLAAIQDQPEVGDLAAEPDRLVLRGNPVPVTGGL